MILDPDGDRAFSITIGRNAVTVETQRPRRAPKDEVADLMQSLLRDALAMREREVGRGALYSSYQEEQEFRLRQREGGREFDAVYESVLKIVVDGWYESERLDFEIDSLSLWHQTYKFARYAHLLRLEGDANAEQKMLCEDEYEHREGMCNCVYYSICVAG
jgi:hypothetical protein